LRQAKSDDKYHSAALDMPQQQFAYCVWICEVMSQQTQVSRVAEYFTRWIQKWPTVQVNYTCHSDQRMQRLSPKVQMSACRTAKAVGSDYDIHTALGGSNGVQGLANATQEEVNDMWAGLGYYRRARLLLEGAQHIQTVLSGQMPLTATELQKIPGKVRACVSQSNLHCTFRV